MLWAAAALTAQLENALSETSKWQISARGGRPTRRRALRRALRGLEAYSPMAYSRMPRE